MCSITCCSADVTPGVTVSNGRVHNICAHCASMCVWVCMANKEEEGGGEGDHERKTPMRETADDDDDDDGRDRRGGKVRN